jgi:hypothetical protein
MRPRSLAVTRRLVERMRQIREPGDRIEPAPAQRRSVVELIAGLRGERV